MDNAERAAQRATSLLYDSAGITFLCEWCGEPVTDRDIDDIDSGTILTCPKCQGESVVDLNRSQQRAAWYKLGLWASRRPRQALRTLADPKPLLCSACAELGYARPECPGCSAIMHCARFTVAQWLQELQ